MCVPTLDSLFSTLDSLVRRVKGGGQVGSCTRNVGAARSTRCLKDSAISARTPWFEIRQSAVRDLSGRPVSTSRRRAKHSRSVTPQRTQPMASARRSERRAPPVRWMLAPLTTPPTGSSMVRDVVVIANFMQLIGWPGFHPELLAHFPRHSPVNQMQNRTAPRGVFSGLRQCLHCIRDEMTRGEFLGIASTLRDRERLRPQVKR